MQTWSAPAAEVFLDARRHCRRVTPRDDRIDQAVAATPLDVGVAVAQSAQVARVVLRGQVDAGVRPGEGAPPWPARPRGRRRPLGRGAGRVRGSPGEPWRCARRARSTGARLPVVPGQLEHARPEGGEDPARAGRHRGLEHVECVGEREPCACRDGCSPPRSSGWLVPKPEQEAALGAGLEVGRRRDRGPRGAAAQMLTMPLATVTRCVAASRRSKWPARPPSKPPDDHSVPYPSASISAAASNEPPSGRRHDPLHQTPMPRSTGRR